MNLEPTGDPYIHKSHLTACPGSVLALDLEHLQRIKGKPIMIVHTSGGGAKGSPLTYELCVCVRACIYRVPLYHNKKVDTDIDKYTYMGSCHTYMSTILTV